MSSSEKIDAFVSYNSADLEIAKNVTERLENEKIGERTIQVFFDKWDVKPGENFIEKVDKALEKANYFVLIMSPEALKAEWPTAERSAALIKDPSGRLGRVIPVLVKSIALPPLLSFRNYVDLRDKSKFEWEMMRLICIVKGVALPRGNKGGNPGQSVFAPSGMNTPLLNVKESSEPDDVIEVIHSNLFHVINLPEKIWKAPTSFTDRKSVYAYSGKNKKLPPFLLKENHLYTFVDLSQGKNPFLGIAEDYDIVSLDTKSWFEDEDHSRWLVQLLDHAIKQHCFSAGLSIDTKVKHNPKYFPSKGFTFEKVKWKSHVKTSTRELILPWLNKKTDAISFYRHRAVSLKFLVINKKVFLRIEPGWAFTYDGIRLIEGKRRGVLSTKIKSRQKNPQEFDEMRFWAWLLSDDGKTIKLSVGSGTINIETLPLSLETSFGVFGDRKELPTEVTAPPKLLGEDEEVSEEELMDDLLSEDEGEEDDVNI